MPIPYTCQMVRILGMKQVIQQNENQLQVYKKINDLYKSSRLHCPIAYTWNLLPAPPLEIFLFQYLNLNTYLNQDLQKEYPQIFILFLRPASHFQNQTEDINCLQLVTHQHLCLGN